MIIVVNATKKIRKAKLTEKQWVKKNKQKLCPASISL